MNVPERLNRIKKSAGSSSRKVKWPLLAAVVVVVVLTVLLIHALADRKPADVAKGIRYLKKIDSEEALARSEKEIKERQAEQLTAQLEKSREGDDSSFDPWSYFNDSVIMGDSRAVGFNVFDYLPKNRVLADSGNTIQTIEDSMDDLHALNPSFIFLCYGLNDVTSGRWKSAKAWVEDYGKEIQKLNEEFPDATVAVNSILPTTEKSVADNERIGQVPDYEEAIRQYCEDHKITFVDCDQIASDHEDLIVEDGIHYHRDFYYYWAAEMIMTAYIGDGSDSSDEAGEGQ